jgi:Asp-tRNA(Asn)/Glu-tRNA(Gln) amidotransferase C subunit
MVSEAKQEEIRKEAKRILDDFSRELEKVEVKEKRLKSNVGGFREEGDGEKGNGDFRKKMFENAPEHDRDCIVSEKKKW